MTAARTESPRKRSLRRLVDEAMNARDLDVLDELCTPAMARRWRAWVAPFQSSFPDMRVETVALVEPGPLALREGIPPSSRPKVSPVSTTRP